MDISLTGMSSRSHWRQTTSVVISSFGPFVLLTILDSQRVSQAWGAYLSQVPPSSTSFLSWFSLSNLILVHTVNNGSKQHSLPNTDPLTSRPKRRVLRPSAHSALQQARSRGLWSLFQEEIDSYTWCLKDPNIGSWVCRGTSNTSSAIPADDSLNVPQVRTGPGLSQNLTPSDQTRYILVIQGRSGASKAKVLEEMSLPMAASAIMHEALNGYSTAFSAAYDGPSLRDLPVGAVFERASGLTAPKMNEANQMVISVVCFVAPRESEKRLSTG